MNYPDKLQKHMQHALTAVMSLGLFVAGLASAADIVCKEQERCYGVSRAGQNDCATSTSACSGTTKQDFQKDAWVYVPKGTCLKLAGGQLKPGSGPAAAK